MQRVDVANVRVQDSLVGVLLKWMDEVPIVVVLLRAARGLDSLLWADNACTERSNCVPGAAFVLEVSSRACAVGAT
jgi:hypothetical protein